MAIIKVSVFQKSLLEGLNLSLQKKLAALKSDFLVFPEFFYADPNIHSFSALADRYQYALDWLMKLSDSYHGTIVGGSFVVNQEGDSYHATPVLSGGSLIDWYRKRELSAEEVTVFKPGTDPGIFMLGGFRFGILINDDVKNPRLFQELREHDVKLIFAIMSSSLKEENQEEKLKRDEELFISHAREHGQYIIKCSSVGELMGKALQGRSMVVTPTGISWRVAPHEEKNEIIKTVMINFQ